MGRMPLRRLWVAVFLVPLLAAQIVSVASAGARSVPERHPNPMARVVKQRLAALRAQASARPAQAAPVLDDFKLLAHLDLPGRAPHGDVLVYDHGGDVGTHAYVGTWVVPCSATGVKIVDLNRPRRPELVALAVPRSGVSTEDMDVVHIGNRDIMGVGVQSCFEEGARPGGLALFDVTEPTRPRLLSFLRTPSGGVHELDLVVRPDGVALALLAVPFAEFPPFNPRPSGEFRIVDISNPKDPVTLADWGVIDDSQLRTDGREITSSFEGSGYFAANYDHSARAEDEGMTAYVSYWDAGVLKFDISDPANPDLVGRTVYPNGSGDDGDAHSLAVYDAGGTRYILQNDEDAEPLAPAKVTSSATGSTAYWGIEEFWMPVLLTDVGTITGPVADAGDGCEAEDFAATSGRIALVDVVDPYYVGIIEDWPIPPCRLGAQIKRAAEAGATAVLLNLVSPDDAYPFPFGTPRAVQDVTIPAVMIADIDGLADAIRATGAGSVTLDPADPSVGHLRVFREGTTDSDGDGIFDFSQVGSFTGLPYVVGAEALTAPAGDWLIHNTEVVGGLSYSAWYSHGIVALDLTDPVAPALVGQFVPEASGKKKVVFGADRFPIVWGVGIDEARNVIVASDMRSGLWVVRPTGDAAPTG